jgi:hypothetical protein
MAEALAMTKWFQSGLSVKKGLVIDPDSNLPVGTIVRNSEGRYGVIEYKGVVLITEETARELLKLATKNPG